MLKYIRPVGEAVSLKCIDEAQNYQDFVTNYFQSGTQALQRALEIAKESRQTEQPEAIIPAYACPDLVSACVGAGIKPVLVDLSANTPFPETQSLEALIGQNTVAVILVNFLGLSPPDSLVESIRSKEVLLVEDRAQGFIPPEKASVLTGDLVIFSFGKGKPVSLLGGGALLVSNAIERNGSSLTPAPHQESAAVPGLGYRLKVWAYNLVIKAYLYFWLLRIPGMNIGATEYKAPTAPSTLPDSKRALLADNIATQHHANHAAQSALYQLSLKYGFALLTEADLHQRLLRFPLLMKDKASRDKMLDLLNRHGIGASAMYQKTLTEIEDVPLAADQRAKNFPVAGDFADRLITLPCHSGVSAAVLNQINRIFMKHASRDFSNNLSLSQKN